VIAIWSMLVAWLAPRFGGKGGVKDAGKQG
jgi:hypothetical protein